MEGMERAVLLFNERTSRRWTSGDKKSVGMSKISRFRRRLNGSTQTLDSAMPKNSISTDTASARLDEPSIQQKKSKVIAGLRATYSPETVHDIPALWARLAPHFGHVPGQVDRAAYGVGIDTCSDSGRFEYVAGVEVNDASRLPSGWTTFHVPAQSYAIFAHHGHVTKLKDTVQAIYHDWLPRSGRKLPRHGPDEADFLEVYGPNFDPSTGMRDMEIWLALGK